MDGCIIVAGSTSIEKQTNAIVVVFANGSGGRWFGSKRPKDRVVINNVIMQRLLVFYTIGLKYNI